MATLSLLQLLVLATLSTARPAQISQLSASRDRKVPLFPDIEDKRFNTTRAVPSEESLEHLYNSIIEILEKINVLPESCIKFEKITREVIHVDKNSGIRSVGVYLYFQESSQWGSNLSEKDTKELSPLNLNSTSTNLNSSSTFSNASFNLTTENSTGSNSDSTFNLDNSAETTQKVRCRSESKVVMMNAYSLKRQNNEGGQSEGSEYNGTTTGVIVGAHSEGDEAGAAPGLSRTQLVVISTCSAIIGVFFLIAGIMRLRNYIKRHRQQQRQASRPTFRSCSVALRNSTPSNEHIHTDSLLSKSSSFHSNYTGRGAPPPQPVNQSSRDNSRNSSPKTYADKAPLLVVTTPSDTTNTSTPTVSQVSLQYSDDDPMKNKILKKSSSKSQDPENRPLLNGDDNHTVVDIGKISDLGYVEKILNKNETDTPSPQQEGSDTKPVSPAGNDVSAVNNPQVSAEPAPSDTNVSSCKDEMVLPIDKTKNTANIGSSNFGLTQSDSSLSSANQNYSYGNQTEYYCEPMDFIPNEVFNFDFPVVYQNCRPLRLPTLQSFSENSFDYGSGASAYAYGVMLPGSTVPTRTLSLTSPPFKVGGQFKRSMSLVEAQSNPQNRRILTKANSLTGDDNPSKSRLPSESICESDEIKQDVAPAQKSAQEKRERFGCAQETTIGSSGDLSREPSSDVRASSPTHGKATNL